MRNQGSSQLLSVEADQWLLCYIYGSLSGFCSESGLREGCARWRSLKQSSIIRSCIEKLAHLRHSTWGHVGKLKASLVESSDAALGIPQVCT